LSPIETSHSTAMFKRLDPNSVDHNKVVTVSAIKMSIRVAGGKSRAKSEPYVRRIKKSIAAAVDSDKR
jgi:hypothetical protein